MQRIASYNSRVHFETVGEIGDVEVIAAGAGVRERKRLRRTYGRGSWRKMKGVAPIKLSDGALLKAELHWYEAWHRQKRIQKSNGSSRKNRSERFLLCVRNDDHPASLERRKLYLLVRDAVAAKHNLVRVIDESGEDYLYPAEYFVALRLPANVKLALSKAS